ncbi:MAG: hypothetical protein DRI44_09680 [Chlamydiae bacterium]|nr:MAG: hypothetical protein DRI44_09680 [Chlamydiota bacterium]
MNKNRKWNARWIWSDVSENEKNVFYYFRKNFNLKSTLENYELFISADTRYQLFINGKLIGRGVPQSQPFYQYYDEYNLDGKLIKGENCIAVVVYHLGTLPDTRGGLLLEITGPEDETVIKTDDTWRAKKSPAWQQNTYSYLPNRVTPFQEVFDARLEPPNWKEISFDNNCWLHSTIIAGMIHDQPPCAGPWAKLVPRDIPFMKNENVFAKKIEKIEENLQLANRSRPTDLSPGLSMVGKPIKYSKVENAENLLNENGVTIVQSSLNHKNLDFDGIYSPAIVLDFGRVITAHSKISLKGAAGSMIDIGYAERLIDGNFNISMECEFADRYILKDGDQVFESFSWKSFRYLKIRFLSCFEPVTINSIEAVISTYPFEEKGDFNSGDKLLNSVFEISRDTLQLCSNEFLMDTPWREQAQWLGDVALVTVPAIYSCYGDTKLARKFYFQAGQNQHPTGMISNISNTVNHDWIHAIPDYSLWWVQGIWEHYLYTGDEEVVHHLYPQLSRILYAHLDYINNDGLIENIPYWPFIDWADVDKRGICSVYNAIFYETLKSWNKIAKFKGDNYTAELSEKLLTKIKLNFNKFLFDEKRGCYADANINGKLSEKISEHGNLTPIFAGLCDAELSQKIIDKVFIEKNDLIFTEAQPFYMAVVLRALDQTDNFPLAISLIRERWGKRMVDKGATSTYEEWYQNGSWRDGDFKGFLRTHSHAWSACPADFLIRRLIGLEILESGCRKIKLSPQKTDFDYDVTFPTPLGEINVINKSGEIKISNPAGIEII